MRHLILHIGNHKTGTTAIQDWIALNREPLAKQGYADLHGPDGPHVHSWLAYVDEERPFPRGFCLADPDRFAADLAALPARKVIASSENFAFFFEQSAIDALARAVAPHFDRVRIVAYLRRQDRHAVSHHAEGSRPDRTPEWALWGHDLTALPAPNPLQPLYLDYNQRLQKWENAFGRAAMVVRIYDKPMLINGDVVVDFADAAGIDLTACGEPIRRNRSMDRVKSRIGHIFNVMTDDIALATKVTLTDINTSIAARPSRGEARAFLAPYLAGNRALNERLGLTSDPDLFDSRFWDLPEQPMTTWTDDEFNRAVRLLGTALIETAAAAPSPEPAPPPEPARPTLAAVGLAIDDLYAAADALAATYPARALRLVEAALCERPNGKMLLELREKLRAVLIKRGKLEAGAG